MLGVPAHATYERRAQRVEEQEPDEIQTWDGLDNASVLDRDPAVGWECKANPTEIRRVSGAPDHVRHFQNPPILELGVTVAHACRLPDPLDTCGDDVLPSYAAERNASWW